MKLVFSKPTSSGIRHQIKIQKNLLCRDNSLIRSLLIGTKRWAGRNSNTGRITVRHQGGGCKQNFRILNFYNSNFFGIVIGVTYDPNRSVFISLNYDFLQQTFFFLPAIQNVNPGSLIVCQAAVKEVRLGYRLQLKSIPTGSIISGVSINFGLKNQYIRSAGTYGQLVQKSTKICKIRLPSGKFLTILPVSYATVGVLTNASHNQIILGKAGKSRLRGIRPSVRGIAMNPVDHPHGGRANGGCAPVTPWGIPTRGHRTVK